MMKYRDTQISDVRLVEYKESETRNPAVLGYLSGVFAEADKANRNKRIYGRSLWEKQCKRLQPLIAEGGVVGELTHPEERADSDPREAAIKIESLELRPDGTVFGKAAILATPSGRITKTLKEAGVKLGVSLRANGNVVERSDGLVEVVDDDVMEIKGFDLVMETGFANAYPTMSESLQKQFAGNFVESKMNKPTKVRLLEGVGAPVTILDTPAETAPKAEAPKANTEILETLKNLQTKITEMSEVIFISQNSLAMKTKSQAEIGKKLEESKARIEGLTEVANLVDGLKKVLLEKENTNKALTGKLGEREATLKEAVALLDTLNAELKRGKLERAAALEGLKKELTVTKEALDEEKKARVINEKIKLLAGYKEGRLATQSLDEINKRKVMEATSKDEVEKLLRESCLPSAPAKVIVESVQKVASDGEYDKMFDGVADKMKKWR